MQYPRGKVDNEDYVIVWLYDDMTLLGADDDGGEEVMMVIIWWYSITGADDDGEEEVPLAGSLNQSWSKPSHQSNPAWGHHHHHHWHYLHPAKYGLATWLNRYNVEILGYIAGSQAIKNLSKLSFYRDVSNVCQFDITLLSNLTFFLQCVRAMSRRLSVSYNIAARVLWELPTSYCPFPLDIVDV